MRYLGHCYSWFKGESEKQIQAIRNADRNLRDANLVNVLLGLKCAAWNYIFTEWNSVVFVPDKIYLSFFGQDSMHYY